MASPSPTPPASRLRALIELNELSKDPRQPEASAGVDLAASSFETRTLRRPRLCSPNFATATLIAAARSVGWCGLGRLKLRNPNFAAATSVFPELCDGHVYAMRIGSIRSGGRNTRTQRLTESAK